MTFHFETYNHAVSLQIIEFLPFCILTRCIAIIITEGEGDVWPPSPLVRVAGATFISNNKNVLYLSEFFHLGV